MRLLSLFSGIGGIDLGLQRAGFTVVGQCEIDPFCRAVLAKHWPDVPRFEDIRDIDPAALPDHDIQAGGFPCQDISSAGKGAGIHAERSGLWWEWLRIIRARRPDWLLVENVPALRTRGADDVIDSLESVGYAYWPLVVGAWAVGAPHRRDRVWIVGRLADAVRNDRDGRDGQGGRGRRICKAGDVVADTDGERTGEPESAISPEPRSNARDDAGGYGRRHLADADPRGLGTDGRAPRGGPDADERGEAMEDSDGGGLRAGWQREASIPDGTSERGLANPLSLPSGRGPSLSRRGPGGRTPTRWPSGPGERQHEWERPRLVESGVGVAVDGLPRRLAGLARRNALRALGNAVVPQVVEVIGRAIMQEASA